MFTPTYVTPVPGEAPGYALTASPGAPAFVRGGSTVVDVTVAPKGGFVSPIYATLNLPSGWLVTYTTIATNVFRMTITVPTTSGTGSVSLPLVTSSGTLSATITLNGSVS